ncbi:MAG: type II secretion system protein GspN [Desulfobacterium sp.]|nr:type II secretion system protein GspN [Desulfobacterium sp.]
MRIKTISLYLTYAVTMFFLIAYLRFPGETASRILGERINRITPKLRVELSLVTPVIPLGFRTASPVITLFNQNRFSLDSAIVSPDILTLFSPTRKINFKAAALNGTVKGTLSTPTDTPLSPMTLLSEFSGLEIPKIHYSKGLIDLEALFKLSGSVEYTQDQPLGSARAQLHLTDLKLTILTPLVQALGFSDFTFTHVDITATMDNDHFEITSFSAPGDKLSITLTGTGTLESPMEKSRLNLRGEIRPDPSHVANFASISSVEVLFQDSENGGIPFTVSGTVENPIFKL